MVVDIMVDSVVDIASRDLALAALVKDLASAEEEALVPLQSKNQLSPAKEFRNLISAVNQSIDLT